MSENKNPEQIARDHIDDLLRQSGWTVQSRKEINLSDGLGPAVREYPTDTGPADYVLFVNRKPVEWAHHHRGKSPGGHRR